MVVGIACLNLIDLIFLLKCIYLYIYMKEHVLSRMDGKKKGLNQKV